MFAPLPLVLIDGPNFVATATRPGRFMAWWGPPV